MMSLVMYVIIRYFWNQTLDWRFGFGSHKVRVQFEFCLTDATEVQFKFDMDSDFLSAIPLSNGVWMLAVNVTFQPTI